MTEDTVHPEDVSPLGRVGNDPIRRAAEHAHRERLAKMPPTDARKFLVRDELDRQVSE